MRTTTGTRRKASLISVSIAAGLATVLAAGLAAGLAGCGPPPEKNIPGDDQPIVPLSKDPSAPLLLLLRKLDGKWCPTKVVSLSQEQCVGAPPDDQDHVACRFPADPIRWIAHDEELHTNPGALADFTISFGKSKDDPLEKPKSFGKTCDKSEEGILDCTIKWKINGKAPTGPYKYTVTMTSSSPNCPALDPRIYINRTLEE